ncbi:MAG: lipoyl synthase [Candidatus Omnitrophica bacterium]|nr:lipoyl synthase [Candidatus Omnitrophota bacterium]
MKPEWLNKKIDLKIYSEMKGQLRQLGVETVCEQAMCPNAGECFGQGVATFLILGRHCTRACSFCNVDKSVPLPPDKDEPGRVAEAVLKFGLKHVVVTSVTRDDLPDGGAGIFADTVLSIHKKSPDTTIEVLVPDFKLSLSALETVIRSAPDIFAHNVETVPSLYNVVRQGSDYGRSLEVLKIAKEMLPKMKTKSGIMLGLGESEGEVLQVMRDLRSVACDFLSIGQYLAPSLRHYPVKEHIPPERFRYFKEKGIMLGFLHIESGPYVRSSYMAGMYL